MKISVSYNKKENVKVEVTSKTVVGALEVVEQSVVLAGDFLLSMAKIMGSSK